MGSTESTLPPMEGGTSNRNHAARLGRESDPSGGEASSDDPWWWEIEHQDLVLDHTPNVTSESASVELSANFDTFLSNAEDANETLNNNGNNNSDVSGDLDGRESANVGASAVDVTVNFTLKKPIARCSKSNESEDTFTEAHKGHGDHVNDEISQSLDEFKEELHQKRLARQAAVQELRDEIAALRKQLTAEQMLTRRLRQSDNAAVGEVGSGMASSTSKNCTEGVKNTEDSSTDLMDAVDVSDLTDSTDLTAVTNATAMDEDDRNVCSRSRHANIELANAQLALQLATSENLSLRTELGVTKKQVGTLKEVVACCKQMLAMKEEQCEQLKIKLSEIEESFGEREAKMMSDNLREEYERQLGNIRQLRQLYEERQRIAAAEQENLQRLISMKRDELAAEQERTKSFEERNQALMKEVETANKELATLREECNEHKFEKKALKEEMGAVNTLFSQMVMGFNGKNNLDIDRLATMLEENRTLLNDMATKEVNCGDGATLPKLLFELVEQAAVDCKVGSRSSTPPTDATDGGGEEQTERCGTERALMVAAATRPEDESSDVAAEQQAKQEVEVGNEQDAISNSYSNSNSNNKEEEQEEDNVNGCTTNNNNNYNTSKKPQHHHHRKSVASRMKISATSAAADATSSTVKFNEPEILGHVASTQEIIGNLPKVWRVLMELLSHHRVEQVQFEENGAGEDCYKSVETPNGPKTELSVSKTYIKLKDLILEKKSLVKETNRLKMLNSHLDYRLNEQEKRLSAVSLELTKTWHLVGKMQRQHRQLHTQEQILRYQLQQKRRLLTELKDELEYCRRKWAAARAKNDESQEQCNDLRREFAKRKLEDASHSAESGYSDSGPASDEESGRPALGESAEEESVCCRRNLLQMFEHSRKIKRMQSTSPGRAAYDAAAAGSEVLLRGSSAPPTCGWYAAGDDEDDVSDVGEDRDESEETATDGDDESAVGVPKPLGQAHGAIPKEGLRLSRSKQCIRRAANIDVEVLAAGEEEVPSDSDAAQPSSAAPNAAHVVRIQRLEEQCKSLIQQMMQTSDNRERLEVQLCRFQDAIAPVQYARPLDDSMTQKRLERMTRASSAPASAAGTLTPREEEYTRKRSERLERLEEESRQLISRIKRTSDRGHYLRCSLERLHKTRNGGGGGGGGGGAAGEGCSSAISREGSFESNTEDEEEAVATIQSVAQKDSSADVAIQTESPLTAAEEAYTARRAERLKRLEAESKELLTQLTRSTQRGSELSNQLDVLHEQHGSKEGEPIDKMPTATSASSTFEHRLENIERISSNRAERLRILEEEGKQLISRLSSTSARGTRMINRIAEREQSRAARHNEAAADERLTAEAATPSPQNNDNAEAEQEEDVSAASVSGAAAPLLPTLKSVACSSIVSEELAECVTVTTTTSRIASGSQIQGAVPKSRPLAQLSVAANVKSKPSTSAGSSSAGESLEEMVNRLRSLPFPDSESAQPQKCTDSEVAESEGKDGRQKSESGST